MSGSSIELRRNVYAPAPPGYFTTPLLPSSTLTLEFDANDDGVAGDVTVAASRFAIQGTFAIGNLIVVSTDFVAELTGGAGVLANDVIDWVTPASYSITGTWQCAGSACDLVGHPANVPLSYADFLITTQSAQINSIPLLYWWLNATAPGSLDVFTDCIEPTCIKVGPIDTTVSLQVGTWTTALDLHGQAVPEPSVALLIAAGLLLRALRRGASLRL